jgi:hypothetical protein
VSVSELNTWPSLTSFSEGQVVLDNAVVHHGHLAGAVQETDGRSAADGLPQVAQAGVTDPKMGGEARHGGGELRYLPLVLEDFRSAARDGHAAES